MSAARSCARPSRCWPRKDSSLRPKTGTQVRGRLYWNMMDPDVLAWRLEAEPGRRLRPRRLRAAPGDRARRGRAGGNARGRRRGRRARGRVRRDGGRRPEYGGVRRGGHPVSRDNPRRAATTSCSPISVRSSGQCSGRPSPAPGIAEQTLPLHEAVLEAIRDGDSEAAEAAMGSLIETTAAFPQRRVGRLTRRGTCSSSTFATAPWRPAQRSSSERMPCREAVRLQARARGPRRSPVPPGLRSPVRSRGRGDPRAGGSSATSSPTRSWITRTVRARSSPRRAGARLDPARARDRGVRRRRSADCGGDPVVPAGPRPRLARAGAAGRAADQDRGGRGDASRRRRRTRAVLRRVFLPQLALATIVPPVLVAWILWRDWISGVLLLVTLPLIPVFGILIGRATQNATLKRFRALQLLSAHFLDVVRGLPTRRLPSRGCADGVDRALHRRLSAHDDGDVARRVPVGVRARARGVARDGARRGRARDQARPRSAGSRSPSRCSSSRPGLRASAHRVGAVPRERRRPRRRGAPARAGVARAGRRGDGRRARAGHRRAASPRPTTAAATSSAEPTSSSAPVSVSRSWGPAAPASRRCSGWCSASPSRRRDGCSSRAATWPTWTRAAWRRRLAWVPQRPLLEPGAVADAVRLGRPDAGDDEVRAALASAGLRVPARGALGDALGR